MNWYKFHKISILSKYDPTLNTISPNQHPNEYGMCQFTIICSSKLEQEKQIKFIF